MIALSVRQKMMSQSEETPQEFNEFIDDTIENNDPSQNNSIPSAARDEDDRYNFEQTTIVVGLQILPATDRSDTSLLLRDFACSMPNISSRGSPRTALTTSPLHRSCRLRSISGEFPTSVSLSCMTHEQFYSLTDMVSWLIIVLLSFTIRSAFGPWSYYVYACLYLALCLSDFIIFFKISRIARSSNNTCDADSFDGWCQCRAVCLGYIQCDDDDAAMFVTIRMSSICAGWHVNASTMAGVNIQVRCVSESEWRTWHFLVQHIPWLTLLITVR